MNASLAQKQVPDIPRPALPRHRPTAVAAVPVEGVMHPQLSLASFMPSCSSAYPTR